MSQRPTSLIAFISLVIIFVAFIMFVLFTAIRTTHPRALRPSVQTNVVAPDAPGVA